MKIYTKKGDNGHTSLFTGEIVSKGHATIQTLGAIDESNSALGSAIAFLPHLEDVAEIRLQLEIIQHALFDVGAAVATPRRNASQAKLERTRWDSAAIALLEQWIDAHESFLPPLKAFILPGGHPSGAMLHLARTICRRAECHAVPLMLAKDIEEGVLIYLNRLSDYLFVTARRLNQLAKCPETAWQHHRGTHQ